MSRASVLGYREMYDVHGGQAAGIGISAHIAVLMLHTFNALAGIWECVPHVIKFFNKISVLIIVTYVSLKGGI